MHITNLRKVGGSVMLAVPPAILEILSLKAGAPVSLAIDEGRLVMSSRCRPRYRLADLLADRGSSDEMPSDDRDWTSSAAFGDELL